MRSRRGYCGVKCKHARGVSVGVAVYAEEGLRLQQLVWDNSDGVKRSHKEGLGVLWVELEGGGHEGQCAPHSAAAVPFPAQI